MKPEKKPEKQPEKFYMGGICLVTDRCACRLTPTEMALLALKSGVKCIQYRDKDVSRLSFYRNALSLRRLTRDYGAYLIINDHADIAALVGADGVHLGQDDLPVREARAIMGDKIVGISTHSLDEALRAEAEGADYVGFGPVMPTKTKTFGLPKRARGVGMLKRIKNRLNIPVVAIGGINGKNLDPVLSSGASAVAVASGILRGDVGLNAGRLVSRLKGF